MTFLKQSVLQKTIHIINRTSYEEELTSLIHEMEEREGTLYSALLLDGDC